MHVHSFRQICQLISGKDSICVLYFLIRHYLLSVFEMYVANGDGSQWGSQALRSLHG